MYRLHLYFTNCCLLQLIVNPNLAFDDIEDGTHHQLVSPSQRHYSPSSQHQSQLQHMDVVCVTVN